ncbi:Diphthamide biosynthesis protein 4 [Yamadazyma tenuis]|uniref:Diphthamide biosynthesis protein 4 n=1 Tax=Candida tenuis (strain ATCC 10573 / BCRC 21748 / CBS 615 / JCM 9827 / NBRC 10315 / NRRL Y-1498 / VKM Y-70) TaxID=590646 RepID=G3B5D6_CANTC|nr:uncharacterized protein CANTEDRAFT_106294 [Yamadazyma tenuis ATCC 10573]EGV63194.1 hypothetical protein CANTEDRAFT_106294 [Yamadazyma tenuis ATCC 10573]WEJ96983.1 Diphthamide biosynthesis protein 4 [Yamadazyma tenuis]
MDEITVGRRSYYEILGVSVDSSDAQIKTAYKQKLLSNHPDKAAHHSNISTDTEINLIQEAYRVLVNQDTRDEYREKLDSFTQTQGVNLNGDGLDIYSLGDFDIYEDVYIKSCPRCTSEQAMKITQADLINGTGDGVGNYEIIVQCSDCSLWIRVEYSEELSE